MNDKNLQAAKTLSTLFLSNGQLKQNNVRVNETPMVAPNLFDENGFIQPEMASAIRSRMMNKTPVAHTDLARLFYSLMAQETYNVPAQKMFE
jgi:hypothetical protein